MSFFKPDDYPRSTPTDCADEHLHANERYTSREVLTLPEGVIQFEFRPNPLSKQEFTGLVQLYQPDGGSLLGVTDRYAGWVTFRSGEDDPKRITFGLSPNPPIPQCTYEVWLEAFTSSSPESSPASPPGNASVSLFVYL
ncbi:hypothetical protein [Streptomyces sp. NPDC126514]|uniref:hypothetical protein n=1 Tax=Streptomyces sp. NPDC126514 TaxID=3155210 RepID=UPI003319E3D4